MAVQIPLVRPATTGQVEQLQPGDTLAGLPVKVAAVIDFVNADGPEDTTASVTVTGQSWVTSSSVIIAGFDGNNPSLGSPPIQDHQEDDAIVEGLTAYIENIVPGTGFDITCHAPLGTWGNYSVYAMGIS